MRTNCLIFAVRLYLRLHRRWRQKIAAGVAIPVPRLVFRQSYIRGGPFHVLVGRSRSDGSVRLVSYKPAADIETKPHLGHAVVFKGRVVWGDPPHP
jgi:hypothetical protein